MGPRVPLTYRRQTEGREQNRQHDGESRPFLYRHIHLLNMNISLTVIWLVAEKRLAEQFYIANQRVGNLAKPNPHLQFFNFVVGSYLDVIKSRCILIQPS